MTSRERSARAGLEIALECDGGGFVGEFDRDHDHPRTIMTRMSDPAVVVPVEPLADIAGPADVAALGILEASEDVHGPLG